MPDRSSARDRDAVAPGASSSDEDSWAPELFDDPPITPRARRRLVTPVTVGLGAILLATAGFIGGVEVQKSQQGSGGGLQRAALASGAGAGAAGAGAGAAAGAAGARGFGGRAGGGTAAAGGAAGGQAQGDTTFGSVADKKGSSLYVQGADDTTVRVKTNAQSKVTRNAAASARGIYPGDTVVVQGTKAKDGSIVATQITATAKSAAASGGGFAGGGFGGGGFRRGFGGGAAGGGAAGGAAGGGAAGATGAGATGGG
jgi:hypothetical protein